MEMLHSLIGWDGEGAGARFTVTGCSSPSISHKALRAAVAVYSLCVVQAVLLTIPVVSVISITQREKGEGWSKETRRNRKKKMDEKKKRTERKEKEEREDGENEN